MISIVGAQLSLVPFSCTPSPRFYTVQRYEALDSVSLPQKADSSGDTAVAIDTASLTTRRESSLAAAPAAAGRDTATATLQSSWESAFEEQPIRQKEDTPAVWSQRGVAAWYGPGFKKKKTASGERFDSRKFTAAHRTLPFNTKVRVMNLDNGRSVVVRINDRGPFTKKRIIDLSTAAARSIGLDKSGTANVAIEIAKE
jgi:rare lipoprotein A (peptidoglycan hydrolase)